MMKRVFIVLIGGCLLAACNQNDAKSTTAFSDSLKQKAIIDSSNYTSIQWLDTTYQEMGKIKEGQTLEVTWRFKNTGDKPLVISNASASCGCTVAEKPEQPVAPGAESAIKAKFNSTGREGEQHKEVYVQANTKGSVNHQLGFRVEVDKK